MAIQISVTGLTPQQQTDVGNAFDAVYGGRIDAGKTKAEWVQLQLLRFMKQVVKTWKSKTHQDAAALEQATVESDYPES